MAKTQVKYITKPNSEVTDYIAKLSPSETKEKINLEIQEFLKDRSNFGLYLYAFSKLSGILLLSNQEDKRILHVYDCFLDNPNNFDYYLDFLRNKFPFYTLTINLTADKKELLYLKKKNKTSIKDNLFSITL